MPCQYLCHLQPNPCSACFPLRKSFGLRAAAHWLSLPPPLLIPFLLTLALPLISLCLSFYPAGKLYSAGGLTSILKELADDIAPGEGEEIYNPFTPVVSPTEEPPAHIDKMFLQTSSGYRPVEQSYYKRSFVGAGRGSGAAGTSSTSCIGIDGISAAEMGGAGRLYRSAGGGSASGRVSYGDTRCLLDAELNR